MKKLLIASVAAYGFSSAPSLAQCSGVFDAGSVCGSITGGPPGQIPNASIPNIFGVQPPNFVFSGPTSGSSAFPSFRTLVGADLPATTSSTRGALPPFPNTTTTYFRGDGTYASFPFIRTPNPTNLFVATAGSDSNSCLLGSPCLTLQHAVNIALGTYDFQGSNLTINVGTGTFAGATIGGPCSGGGGAAALVILGNGSTNTTISSTIAANDYANVQIGSMKIAVSSGSDVLVENYSTVTLANGGMNFGAAVDAIVDAVNYGSFRGSSNFGFTISGGATAAFLISTNSSVQLSVGATYTITGTPAFPNGFVNAIDGSNFNPGITSVFSGSATGPTYNMSLNSFIDMEQNLSALPGSTGGILEYGSSYFGVPLTNAIGVGGNLLTVNGNTAITPQSNGVATWSGGTLTGLGIGQIPGTATNDNATAGNIGEYVESKATNGTATVTITNASPGVVSWTAHGLNIGSPVNFTTTGGLPTGLTVGTNYYVCSTSFGANSFTVAISVANALAGTPINTSSAGSGTQTAISNVVQATSTAVNVTGISLTAGDWDIEFDAQFTGGTTTTVTSFGASVSLSSATIDTTNGRTDGRYTSASTIYNGFALGVFPSARTGALRFSLNATTTIFGVVESTFGTSTSAAFGLMRARRVR